MPPGKPLPLLVHKASTQDQDYLARNRRYLQALAKLERIELLDTDAQPPASATALVGELELLIPLAGLIDVAAENQRLKKELDKLEKERSRLSGKLNNPNFVNKAPTAVVDKEKAKLQECEQAIHTLSAQQQKLSTLA